MTTDLIFLDTETTGLDPALHQIWEVAWAVDDGPISAAFLSHDVRTAAPEALAMNRYWERSSVALVEDTLEIVLKTIIEGATIVGANPAFDTAFLRARWGVAPWHHRLIDVEAMALAVLNYDRPKGLHALAADLRDRGHDIPAPDHTAAADVATTRAVYNALRIEAAK